MGKHKGEVYEHKVYLRALELEDEEFLIELRKRKDLFEQTVGNTYFASREHSKKLLRENLFSDGKKIYLMICLTKNNNRIGYISLTNIDHINKKVKIGGFTIDSSHSGKGYATLAVSELLKFAFEELNMNKVYSLIIDSNKASLKIHKKLGFVQEGYLKDHVYKSGRYNGVYYLSLFKKEYDKNNLQIGT